MFNMKHMPVKIGLPGIRDLLVRQPFWRKIRHNQITHTKLLCFPWIKCNLAYQIAPDVTNMKQLATERTQFPPGDESDRNRIWSLPSQIECDRSQLPLSNSTRWWLDQRNPYIRKSVRYVYRSNLPLPSLAQCRRHGTFGFDSTRSHIHYTRKDQRASIV
jgi:hypothetical protein